MTIQWPSNTKEIIDEIRGAIGRDITINVRVQENPCPDCSLDPVTNTSTDPFCTTCSGVYWLTTSSGVTVSGHVRWTKVGQPLYEAGGTIIEGDCIATIEYNANNLNYIENSESFIVDNRDLYLKHYVLKGVPEINRIRLVLLEDSE